MSCLLAVCWLEQNARAVSSSNDRLMKIQLIQIASGGASLIWSDQIRYHINAGRISVILQTAMLLTIVQCGYLFCNQVLHHIKIIFCKGSHGFFHHKRRDCNNWYKQLTSVGKNFSSISRRNSLTRFYRLPFILDNNFTQGHIWR